MKIDSTNKEISDVIVGEGAADSYKCYQCGKCMSVCPWYLVKAVDFVTYRIPQSVRLGTVTNSEDAERMAHEVEEIFRCLGCEACRSQCPHGVNIAEIVRSIRKVLFDYDAAPPELKVAVGRVQSDGNPLGEPREKRNDWLKEIEYKKFDGTQEYAFYSCCTTAYDERLKKVGTAGVEILKRGGIDFGIITDEEQNCCLEAVRRVGAMNVFQPLAEANIALFSRLGIKKIITTSPHCYTIFKNEYGKIGENLQMEPFHQAQIFDRLIKERRIVPKNEMKKKIVYHDPCTLGRQNGIYDEPRNVLRSIPGVELVEIPVFNREYSICCSGGGGGVWLDRPINERISDIRLKQACDTGANILAVACPYCLQMFEDSLKRVDCNIIVRDVAELLLDSII